MSITANPMSNTHRDVNRVLSVLSAQGLLGVVESPGAGRRQIRAMTGRYPLPWLILTGISGVNLPTEGAGLRIVQHDGAEQTTVLHDGPFDLDALAGIAEAFEIGARARERTVAAHMIDEASA